MSRNNHLYIQTFGCQMNVHDARRMEELLMAAGYELASAPTEAELIIINTCSVREKSYEKVLSAIGRAGQLKKKKPNLMIGVAGCVAQQEGARLLASPHVDLVFSPDHIHELPQLVERARSQRQLRTGFVDPKGYQFLRAAPQLDHPPTALVTIQKGCDNSCSYCIVPSVRGPAVSRDRREIVEEVRSLVDAGVREVTLIGQNVNSYRGGEGGDRDFISLLEAVDGVGGLARIRFTTSHPKDIHPELAESYARLPSLCPWLHLPVQSGSTRVLSLMNRGYTRADYIGQVEQIRRAVPHLTLGTDLIVGFPGESEQDFLETISLLEQIQFDYAYSFKFSIRPGTSAERLGGEAPREEEKRRRLAHLQRVQDAITHSRLQRWVGQEVQVLVEGPSRQGLPQLCGRSPGNHVVNFEHPAVEAGQLVMVEITEAGKHSLHGEITSC